MKEKGKNHRHRMDKAKYEIIIEERRERREDLDNRYIYIWLAYQQTRTNERSLVLGAQKCIFPFIIVGWLSVTFFVFGRISKLRW